MKILELPKLNKEIAIRKYQEYSLEKTKSILIGYMFNGLSHRKLDEEVLGLDSKKTKGFKSMGVLHNLGIDARFKNIFNGYSIQYVITIMSKDSDYEKLVGILKNDDSVVIPPLVIQKRNSAFSHYSAEQISQVVYGYIFEGKTHRQLDRDVLLLDYKKTKGFQSFAILNHLGLNGKFKGLFTGMTLEQGLILLKNAGDVYCAIVDYLEGAARDKGMDNNSDQVKSDLQCHETNDQNVKDEIVEIVLTDYSMHGGRRTRR